jgi:ribonuclease HII
LAKRPVSKRNAAAPENRRPRPDAVDIADRYLELEAFDRGYAEAPDGGLLTLAGVDEAGRGALAGPVVSAAVILPRGSGLVGVDDSKKLTGEQREELFGRIVASAAAVSIACGHPPLIDLQNILGATLITMHRAVERLRRRPDIVLVDGRDAFQWRGRVIPVTKGDSRSLVIAAASIVAKVARDRLMSKLHKRFPQYNFDRNKGYGTRDHLAALVEHGPAPAHRKSFHAKVIEKNLSMF